LKINLLVLIYKKFRKKISYFKNLFNQLFSQEIIKSKYGISFHKNWIDNTFRLYIDASYGFYFWDKIKNISNEFIFIDVGANQGLYTICAAKNYYCKKVYSFEPVKNTFLLLEKNTRLNNIDNKCQIFNKGIGIQNQILQIKTNNKHSGAASLRSINKTKKFDKIESIEIINQEKLNKIIDVDSDLKIICKIDVEGYEKFVITTLMKTKFANNIDLIFYEINENWVDPEEIKKYLKNYGFTKFEKTNNSRNYDVLASKIS